MLTKKWLRRIAIILTVTALMWFVVPLFFNKQVNESRDDIKGEVITNQMNESSSVSGSQNTEPVALSEPKGTFVGVLGHRSSGNVTLVKTTTGNYIRLEDDFSVTSGPDLHVYVGDTNKPLREIAELKGNRGGQNYQLPADLDPTSFSTVWIYCKAFVTNFAKADLKIQ